MDETPPGLAPFPEAYADGLVQDLRTVLPDAWPDAEFVQEVLAQLP